MLYTHTVVFELWKNFLKMFEMPASYFTLYLSMSWSECVREDVINAIYAILSSSLNRRKTSV